MQAAERDDIDVLHEAIRKVKAIAVGAAIPAPMGVLVSSDNNVSTCHEMDGRPTAGIATHCNVHAEPISMVPDVATEGADVELSSAAVRQREVLGTSIPPSPSPLSLVGIVGGLSDDTGGDDDDGNGKGVGNSSGSGSSSGSGTNFPTGRGFSARRNTTVCQGKMSERLVSAPDRVHLGKTLLPLETGQDEFAVAFSPHRSNSAAILRPAPQLVLTARNHKELNARPFITIRDPEPELQHCQLTRPRPKNGQRRRRHR